MGRTVPNPLTPEDWWTIISRSVYHTYELMADTNKDYMVPVIFFWSNQLIPGIYGDSFGKPTTFELDFEELDKLPPGTLGHAFTQRGQSMRSMNAEAKESWTPTFRAVPAVQAMMSFLCKRMDWTYEEAEEFIINERKTFRRFHDLSHLLTEYDMSWEDEVYLQAFMFSQAQTVSYLLLSVGGMIRGIVELRPDVVERTIEGYRRGAAAETFHFQNWNELWALPLEEVRKKLNIQPLPWEHPNFTLIIGKEPTPDSPA